MLSTLIIALIAAVQIEVSLQFIILNKNHLYLPLYITKAKTEEFEEKFIKGSGPGGQKINKSSSCVQLKHKNYPIVVKCQHSRDLQENRIIARRILAEKISSIEEEDRMKHVNQLLKEQRRILKLSDKDKAKNKKFKQRRSEIKRS